MNYTRYTISDDHQTLLAEAVQIAEWACKDCGATWLPGLSPKSCPYCGHQHFIESGSEQLFNAILTESAASYGRDIHGVVRALWNSSIDIYQAFSLFDDTVRIGLTQAATEGAKSCGITPGEFTPEESMTLTQIIASESARIFSFLIFIEEHNKASGGKFGALLGRTGLWANRWADTKGRFGVLTCGNKKKIWALGYSLQHCSSCQDKLAGKVKRASYWWKKQILPRVPGAWYLVCKGYT